MDVVTFETAVKLKVAGFPQPEPEVGQVWYMPNGETFIFLGRISSGAWTVCSVDYDEIQNIYPNDMVFAPTATDILPKLEHPDPTVDFFLFWSDGFFSVIQAYWMDASGDIAEHTNAAEALAIGWLELKKEQANDGSSNI